MLAAQHKVEFVELLMAHPIILYVALVVALIVIGVLLRLVYVLVLRFVKRYYDDNREAISATNSAVEALGKATEDSIGKLQIAYSEHAKQNRETMAELNKTVGDFSKSIHALGDMLKDRINETASDLHARVNETNERLGKHEVASAERFGKVEGEVRGLHETCQQCGIMCPYRSGKQVSPCKG